MGKPPVHYIKMLVVGWVCLLGHQLAAQVNVPENLLATLIPNHPRLLVKSIQDFEDIKRNIANDPFLKKSFTEIQSKSDGLLNMPVVNYVLVADQGGKLLEVSRVVVKRTYLLAFMYRLTNEKKYAERLWSELLAASQFPDWNPWHFLDDAEMTHAFAIGYDWLYEVWTPEQRKIIRQAIIEKGLLRAYMSYNDLTVLQVNKWPKSKSNWNQVCNGGIGLGALAIADEEPKLSAAILKSAITLLPDIMNKLAPDGANDEGPGYWDYGIRYNVALIASLQTALGTDFGLSDIAGFSKTASYFLAMAGATGNAFNYADCWIDTIQSPELFWFAKRFHQPLYAQFQKAHPLYTPLEMLWYEAGNAPVTNLPENNYYKGIEVVTMRSAWNDPNAWFIGFKAGNNAAGHSHLDIGNFVIEKNGKRWAIDLAHDKYGLPGYFDAGKNGKRWDYYRLKAEGHNTLVINPDKNPDQDPLAATKLDTFFVGASMSYGIMDITNAYAGKASSIKRGLALQNKKQVLVQDEITATHSLEDLYWFMQTPAEVQISTNKKTALLTIEGQQLKVQMLSPANGTFEVSDATALPNSAQPEIQTENMGIRRLTIHLKGVTKKTIAVVFKEVLDTSTTLIKPLSNW